MKIKALREKSFQDLGELLTVKQNNIRELRFSLASGKVKNVKALRETKKDIARILTILNNKKAE